MSCMDRAKVSAVVREGEARGMRKLTWEILTH